MSESEASSMPALAASRPPASLSEFALSAETPADPGLASVFVVFKLACRDCGGNRFRFISFPKVAPDPSPYHAIAPGETFYRPPHHAQCVGCNRRSPVFDARTDGYDGRLNGGCAYESGAGEDAARPGEFQLTVWVGYNVDLDELAELANEYGTHPSDLFDALTIEGRSEDGAVAFEEVYECA